VQQPLIVAAKTNKETTMLAYTTAQEGQVGFAQRTSAKGVHLAALLGALLLVSIAVNGLIILADSRI
jgi:hypothetical protein